MASFHLLKISRLEGLTDGIFAIAMTILILNLHVPNQLDDTHLLPFIKNDTFYNLFIFMGSFIILGTHWIAMSFQMGLVDHLNRAYLWVNMIYLMVICVVPFSANLLGIYPHSTSSIYFYAVNLLCASLGQLLIFLCARYFDLYKNADTANIYWAGVKRVLVAPPFYICSVVLASWNITAAFILLVLPTIIYLKPGRIDRYENQG